jgi:4a-hydroxytetrahydrobiopterin dehydratase
MEELAKKECKEGTSEMVALSGPALHSLANQLGHGWQVVEERRLRKAFEFADFASALAFVNRVGALAEAQNHHPDLQLCWGQAVVEIWTHTVDGLTESDFVFAAKTERLER